MLPAALTTKLGPLPAWAWGLLVGVGVLGYAYLHRSSSSASSSDTSSTDTTGAGTDAGTPADTSTLDQTAPLDFAGPTSGVSGVGDNVPQSLRIDPTQWARLQKEIRTLQREEKRDAQRSPKHKKKTAQPKTTAHKAAGAARPRATSVPVNGGQQAA